MLAYYFPPLGGGGVQRTLKHVKYLPDEGFEPIVVTARPSSSRCKDPSLEADVPPQAVVLRAPELPLYLVKWALASLLERARLPTALADVVAWPDELAGWAPGALFCRRSPRCGGTGRTSSTAPRHRCRRTPSP